MSNGVGVIDSDYIGELKVAIVNIDKEAQTIEPGERIAQLVLVPVIRGTWTLCDDLEKTERTGGFGSTGVK